MSARQKLDLNSISNEFLEDIERAFESPDKAREFLDDIEIPAGLQPQERITFIKIKLVLYRLLSDLVYRKLNNQYKEMKENEDLRILRLFIEEFNRKLIQNMPKDLNSIYWALSELADNIKNNNFIILRLLNQSKLPVPTNPIIINLIYDFLKTSNIDESQLEKAKSIVNGIKFPDFPTTEYAVAKIRLGLVLHRLNKMKPINNLIVELQDLAKRESLNVATLNSIIGILSILAENMESNNNLLLEFLIKHNLFNPIFRKPFIPEQLIHDLNANIQNNRELKNIIFAENITFDKKIKIIKFELKLYPLRQKARDLGINTNEIRFPKTSTFDERLTIYKYEIALKQLELITKKTIDPSVQALQRSALDLYNKLKVKKNIKLKDLNSVCFFLAKINGCIEDAEKNDPIRLLEHSIDFKFDSLNRIDDNMPKISVGFISRKPELDFIAHNTELKKYKHKFELELALLLLKQTAKVKATDNTNTQTLINSIQTLYEELNKIKEKIKPKDLEKIIQLAQDAVIYVNDPNPINLEKYYASLSKAKSTSIDQNLWKRTEIALFGLDRHITRDFKKSINNKSLETINEPREVLNTIIEAYFNTFKDLNIGKSQDFYVDAQKHIIRIATKDDLKLKTNVKRCKLPTSGYQLCNAINDILQKDNINDDDYKKILIIIYETLSSKLTSTSLFGIGIRADSTAGFNRALLKELMPHLNKIFKAKDETDLKEKINQFKLEKDEAHTKKFSQHT